MQVKISSRRENRCRCMWVIKFRVFRKVFSEQFYLPDAEENTSGLLNRGGIVDLPLLRSCWKWSFREVIDAFFFINICKCGSFKNPLAMITSMSELYFRFRRFLLLVQMQKVISMQGFIQATLMSGRQAVLNLHSK